jgi:hypothetical protein
MKEKTAGSNIEDALIISGGGPDGCKFTGNVVLYSPRLEY